MFMSAIIPQNTIVYAFVVHILLISLLSLFCVFQLFYIIFSVFSVLLYLYMGLFCFKIHLYTLCV
jgi:hypothetical protein